MSKLTILYPVVHYPPVIGGLEQWEQNIAERQSEDIKVVVVTGRVEGMPDYEEKNGVEVFRVSLFSLKNFSYSSPLYIITASAYILFHSVMLARRREANMFHCHGFVSAVVGCLVSLATRKPFIGTEQSLGWAHGPTKFLRSFVYKKAAVCIASSSAVAEEFRKLGVWNVAIIPNGVDVSAFTNVGRPTSYMGSAFVILSVGRLEKVKGYRYLLQAFELIKREIPEARLKIIGDGNERKALEKQASDMRESDSIEFVGEVPHDNLPEYFRGADVFVMPSLSEGFGITALEAMAARVPVVASKVGGLLDIVKDGETGMLADPQKPKAISDAVIRLRNDHSYRDGIVKNAEAGLAKYRWRMIATNIGRLYVDVVKRI